MRLPSSTDTTVVSAAEVSSLLTPHSTLPEETTILLTGDILLDRGVRQVIERHGVSRLFSEGVDSVFQSAQVVVGNLECPATKIKSPVFKRFIFRGEPEWLDTLRQHGITHLNLANNHSIDQGREGLIDTRNNILASGMVPIGAGENMQEAAEPVLLASEPRKVWLVPSLRLALENYAYLPDKPCVSQEPMDSLLARQRHDAHMIVHAGADVLVCHHTHTLQSVEDYGGRKIYYSIGNFIFDQPKPLNARAAMVRLRITADSLSVETLPVEIRHCAPHIK